MSFDRDHIRRLADLHGQVARVVVADVAGSTPREVGASMLVWETGQDGTIGGGTLEFEAAHAARSTHSDRMETHALGPSLGQCCGGSVTVLTEFWDAKRFAGHTGDIVARPLPGREADMPLSVSRILMRARNSGARVGAGIVDGWMIEPVSRPSRALWIFGAGHVGRALVEVLHPLPDIEITWVDTKEDRFPSQVPSNVHQLVAADPAHAVSYAPENAEHLILTYSHALDLALCHALLTHGFLSVGLIGSATKWARFRKRLGELGHTAAQIDRIQCPIGDPMLGKHPQAIAVGVAAGLLNAPAIDRSAKDAAG